MTFWHTYSYEIGLIPSFICAMVYLYIHYFKDKKDITGETVMMFLTIFAVSWAVSIFLFIFGFCLLMEKISNITILKNGRKK